MTDGKDNRRGAGAGAGRRSRGGLRGRLLRSHLLIAGTWVGVLVAAIAMTVWLGAGMTRLANLHGPTASATTQALSGLHHSLAALRGWMDRGDAAFRVDRRRAWDEEVLPALAELDEISKKWTQADTREDRQRLEEIRQVMAGLNESQWWIEEVGQTPGNQPASMSLTLEAAPLHHEILVAIGELIDLERALPLNPQRQELLAEVADLREFLRHAHMRLVDYVGAAPQTAKADLMRYLAIAGRRLELVQARAQWLGPEQLELLRWMSEALPAYERVARHTVELRGRDDWDVAQHLMTTEAIPLARRASELLTAISASQTHAMRSNATRASVVSHAMLGLGAAVVVGIGVAAWHISQRSAERITAPISALSRATRELAAGRLGGDIPIESDDELGELTASFNAMRASLKASEDALTQRNTDLEKQVVERQKAELELKAFAQKLERSNRDLEEFARVASHDLQEPLRKVRAFGDRLKSKYADQLPEGGRDYVERMQSATERMQTLINDLLTFSRVTTRANPFQAVDLSEVVGQVLSDLELRIQDNEGRVDVGSLPTIDADPTQMRQLFQNLIGNALKYCKPDVAPVVRVMSWPDEPGGGRCVVTVEDNGIGFEMRHAEKIFTVFQRLHGRSEYEGTGVGLAVCRKIVARHGGTIRAESEPGKGSKFTVVLPLRQAAGAEAEAGTGDGQEQEAMTCTA